MKTKFAIGLCAATLLFCGCSGDGTVNSSNSNASGSVDNFDIPGILLEVEHISVDEKAGVYLKKTENNCTREVSNSPLHWDSPARSIDVNHYYYIISNDTLYIEDFPHGEITEESSYDVYIGNSSGSIFGSWKDTRCWKKVLSGRIDCSDHKEVYKEGYLTFTKDSLYTSYTANEGYNYMNTGFVYDLYEFLENPDRSLEGTDRIIDTYDETDFKQNNITVIESNKTSQTFKYNEQAFIVKVKNVELGKDYEVEVSSNNKTCISYYRRRNVTEDLCREEYKDNLLFDREYYDEEPVFEYAYRYSEDNTEEFEECLKSLIP